MPHLLVIDDDREMPALPAGSLAAEGFTVTCAGGAEEGLGRLETEPAELVLRDVMLAGINGFEALRRLRTRSRGAGDHADGRGRGYGQLSQALQAQPPY